MSTELGDHGTCLCLAARDDAIIPLFQDRPGGSHDLTRLVVEKVASISTRAAGGNASRMSLAGE